MRNLAWIAGALALIVATSATSASAQPRGGRGRGRPPPTPEPKPSSTDDEEDRGSLLRAEPVIAPPQDPLAMAPETRANIGSDWDGRPPAPDGPLHHTQWFPYEERRGDYRLRMIPPLYIEQTRGLRDPTQALYGVPKTEDTEGLYGLLYYRRRSLSLDMDVLFPGFWRVRDRDNHVVVAGPVVHREAPGEHDNWLAPLYFEGARKDGGYFHSLALLTTSHWGAQGAFTLVGPYFRDRTGSDIDFGVLPFFVHGDNGNIEGNHRSYTLIPPLLTYHADHEIDGSSITVVGPVVSRSNPKRGIFDVAPFFFHIWGKSEGVPEDHLTIFPLLHYGHAPDQTLFVTPGWYSRTTATSHTLITPIWTSASTRKGATSLTAVGPVVPIVWNYTDRDLGVHAWAVAPFFYQSDSPVGHDWLTPLAGHFETYGVSRTWWLFPTVTLSTDTHGWEDDLHPIVYVGRSDESSHTVVAPVFWDFANPKGRTTVAFPLYWRFADGPDDSVTQVAANTVYVQKRVAGGHDWQFHFVPLLSYGESPNGHFWNLLFGLAGYSRDGAKTQVRAFWIPFDSGGPPAAQTAVAR